MNIRLDIENNVASSSGARIVQPGQLLDYELCAFTACRGTNLPYTFYFLAIVWTCRPLFKNALPVYPSVSQR